MRKLRLFLLLIPSISFAQDRQFGKQMVDTLSSTEFWGRGYTKQGMQKAAAFLSEQFKSFGLTPMKGSDFRQEFSYPVNTFPGDMKLNINGQELSPGKDFIVSPDSKGVKATGELQQIDSVQFLNRETRLLVKLEDKLTWSVAPEAGDFTMIMIDKKALNSAPRNFKVDIENKFVSKFKAANVCGVVKGTTRPDSVILITAHYDHLGGMGKEVFFPGANDNASGVSLLLNLARYYAKNPAPYTMAFICFAGEEAGLIGSKYFTENPLLPLKSIRFMINTDLAGTGEEGITVVNATEYPKEFETMTRINDQDHLLAKINVRGKAANSDHYFFTEKGVPAFYFYTMGGIKAYHDVFDVAATLPLNEHEDLFKLLVSFVGKLSGK